MASHRRAQISAVVMASAPPRTSAVATTDGSTMQTAQDVIALMLPLGSTKPILVVGHIAIWNAATLEHVIAMMGAARAQPVSLVKLANAAPSCVTFFFFLHC